MKPDTASRQKRRSLAGNEQIDAMAKASQKTWLAYANSPSRFRMRKSPNMKREHRTVTLPDYQGVGIGNKLSAYIGSMCRGLDCRYVSITSHPAMMRSRARSTEWKMIAKPNATTKTFPGKGISGQGSGATGGFSGRLRATFEYVGKSMDKSEALALWGG